jgi:hypothetical protein
MPDVVLSRKQRLRTLEDQIRKNYEAFVATGFALKEIRDDDLYTEDGFQTWDQYLRERVGHEFKIEKSQAFDLILCAQVRMKLPTPVLSGTPDNGNPEWSIREVKEFARLAPKKKQPGQPYDVDRLDKRDVGRVAKKVIDYCKDKAKSITSRIVRKFVDEDLGVNRAGKAKETKKAREESAHPDLRQYLVDFSGQLEVELERFREVNEDGWKQLVKRNPGLVRSVATACAELAELFRSAEA